MQIEALHTDSVVLTELGARLARTRLERNTSQELAIEAGVSKSTVERLESGRDAAGLPERDVERIGRTHQLALTRS